MDVMNDVSIEADAGHQQEVAGDIGAAGEMAHGDAAGRTLIQPLGDQAHALAEFQLHGQHIGGAAGENRERDVRTDHAFGGFVDGAVSAGGDYEVGALFDVIPGDGARGAGTGGGSHGHVVTAVCQNFYKALDESAAVPSESPGKGIVDQDGVPVATYVVRSGIGSR